MTSKTKKNKTINTIKTISVPPVSSKIVAAAVGCSVDTVKKVRIGARTDSSIIGSKVKLFDEMYTEGCKLLIKEIIRRIKI